MNAQKKDLIGRGFKLYYHKSNPNKKRWLQLGETEAGYAGWILAQDDAPAPKPAPIEATEQAEDLPEVKKPTRHTRKTK